MGMDVYGKNPTSSVGEYFRNNVWYWHPLWDYCCHIDNKLIKKVPYAHENSGDGLGLVASRKLGLQIQESISNGEAQKYIDTYYQTLQDLPDEPCFCTSNTLFESYTFNGEIPFPKKDPKKECNLCNGSGMKQNWNKNYHITLENIQNFSLFLLDCGGFQIC